MRNFLCWDVWWHWQVTQEGKWLENEDNINYQKTLSFYIIIQPFTLIRARLFLCMRSFTKVFTSLATISSCVNRLFVMRICSGFLLPSLVNSKFSFLQSFLLWLFLIAKWSEPRTRLREAATGPTWTRHLRWILWAQVELKKVNWTRWFTKLHQYQGWLGHPHSRSSICPAFVHHNQFTIY